MARCKEILRLARNARQRRQAAEWADCFYARPYACAGNDDGFANGDCDVYAEATDSHRTRGAAVNAGRTESGCRDPDGQPGTQRCALPDACGARAKWGDRQGKGGAYLVQPADLANAWHRPAHGQLAGTRERPFVERVYLPCAWRGGIVCGAGALGDMGCHIIDPVYWSLGLDAPTAVWYEGPEPKPETFPKNETITYEFRGTKYTAGPTLRVIWYDGGLMPRRPDELEEGRLMGDSNGGVLYVGSKGKLMHGCYGKSPRLIPETRMQAFKLPPKTLPRSPGIHEEWIAAIKSGNGVQTTSNFEYAAKLTETMLLGNIAVRMAPKNVILKYDAEKMTFTNMPEADQYLTKAYRPGWSLEA